MEFAVVGTVLVAMLLPVIDIGMGFYYKTQLMTAAQAGAQYALNNRGPYITAWTATSITNAVINATRLSILSSDITTTLSCKCVDQTTGTLSSGSPSSPTKASDCTTSATNCPGMGTQKPGAYVAVSVTPASPRNYKPVFNFQGYGPLTLTASAIVRIQ